MKYAIEERLEIISECLYSKIREKEKKSFGLYTGEFGILLFLFYYSKYSSKSKYTLLTEEYAQKMFGQFLEKESIHTFCSGFSGELYLVEYLRENNFIDFDIRPVQKVLDDYLVCQMRQNIQNHYYDFMHGALGVGLYFLKRKVHSHYIRELIDFLYESAEKDIDKQLFKWESVIDSQKNLKGYNLSMSHGIASIIIFLSRVVKDGFSGERVKTMLEGAVNFVLSQKRDLSQFGSYYPSYVLKNGIKNIPTKSPLSWCYGDLGLGVAFWQAGTVLSKREWIEEGLKIFQLTRIINLKEDNVLDAGICHGSAGIAMIFRRMFFETNNEEFRKIGVFWLNKTLTFANFEDGLAGYKTFSNSKWSCDYSLLTGISGIGLVLLSYLKNEQKWDEMFLLS
ncbi:MAG: lanthionine synthetase C family protein [Tannerellaceae bacterium]|nr:lanthionine synthetase C family protein [Tannerellaceae bacterium]